MLGLAMPLSKALPQEYRELCSPPPQASPTWMRQRGYRFEKLLNGLLTADGLDPRTSYKLSGEQVDGSFFFDGTVFLLEAKWHSDEIAASALYEFKGKVDGKLLGTLGVFVSMSGYSKDAVDALTLGKTLNTILFDRMDIDAVVLDGLGVREVLRRKLRAAAEQGLVYFPAKSTRTTRSESAPVPIEVLEFEPSSGEVFVKSKPAATSANLLILCEGSTDNEVLSTIAQRILATEGRSAVIQTVVARGKQSLPRLANALRSTIAPNAKILIVVDSDGDVEGTTAMLQQKIEFSDWTTSIPDPEIEAWLGLDLEQLRKSGPMTRLVTTLNAAKSVDLKSLRETNSSFSSFYRAVSEA